MGITKVMMIRHAEKPGTYGNPPATYDGIGPLGNHDKESLVTLGWERAGAIANLFAPTNKSFQNPELVSPTIVYAADPADKHDKEPSQRPWQTISALVTKMQLPSKQVNASFKKKDFAKMVTDVLALPSGIVLISWQHQDILPATPGTDCIVTELLQQSGTKNYLPVPSGPWPENRYDMVLVFDRPSGTGPFTGFAQVPQLLLAGDTATLFPVAPVSPSK